jgi:hypothetical protein
MKDSQGRDVLGLTRREIEGLLAGKLCCFHAETPYAGAQHICIYFAESNAGLLQRLREAYPDTASQAALGAPLDLRTRPERGDN